MREPAGDQAADRAAPAPRSFAAAIRIAAGGAAYAARRHPNLRTHIAIAGFVLLGGAAAGCSAVELALLTGAIGLVLAAELVNTSIEMLTDLVSPRYDPRAAAIKDVSAAAVLVASGAAVALAAFILVGRAWPGTPLPGRTAAALGAACLTAFVLAVRGRTADA
ncbi:MAG TPA: diacylglycerol kinase family protein [bacterium]|nr:diacylglycerol kinase family protein [bacterium]